MNKPLAGKVIVIVGGTAGLGLSAARACIDAGARLVAVGRSDEEAQAAQAVLGDNSVAMAGDATDSATARRAIERAVETFGDFDALYHVAGGSGRAQGDGPLHELSDAGIQYTLDLNLISLVYSNRAATQAFLKRGRGGCILNMSSVLGFSPSPKHFATHVYAAAKAASIGFTRSCASYYAADDIRFNALAPGLVRTPMAHRAANEPTIQRFIKDKQPLDGGRIGSPEDLDAAVVFLLSDGAKFITGQTLAIDGGWAVTDLSNAMDESVSE